MLIFRQIKKEFFMAKKVIVIGAVALGPKAASRLKRLSPDTEITMIDQSRLISFGGCGIPYYVSGEVNALDALRATNYGTVRDPAYFEQRGIRTLNETRVTSIDRAAHTVSTEHVVTGEKQTLHYDTLILGTGSTPKMPPVAGLDLKNVTSATKLEAAEAIRAACSSGKINNAVVVGGGFIGLEMAVALADPDMWGINTTVVEFMDQVMPGVLSPTLADMVRHDLEAHGVHVYTSEGVQRLEGSNGSVCRVVTNKRSIDADLVIFATGFAPNSSLAAAAGLAVDPVTKGILVDEHMRTSDPDIYAGGDCVAVKNLITGKPGCFQLGSIANRQGRVIGTNAAGGQAVFSGAVGTWAVKVFGISACGVGLTPARAKAAGFDPLSVDVEQLDRAHFYPEKEMMTLELTVDRNTRQVLGLQGVCTAGDALKARIDAVAALLQFGPRTLDELANLEAAYAPPFSGALDTVNVVANMADNVLSGQMKAISSHEFMEMWNDRENNNVYFADARPRVAAEKTAAAYPGKWHALPLEDVLEGDVEAKLAELPKDRPIALICNTGLRSYEVMLRLKKAGFTDMTSAMGGMQTLLKRGESI